MQYNEVCAVVASNIIVMRKNEAGPATAPISSCYYLCYEYQFCYLTTCGIMPYISMMVSLWNLIVCTYFWWVCFSRAQVCESYRCIL